MQINYRVEYECTPVRHIAVQCPECKRWYHGRDITHDDLDYDYQIEFAEFECPVCYTKFSCFNYHRENTLVLSSHIEECGDAEEVYEGCLTKKEVWK